MSAAHDGGQTPLSAEVVREQHGDQDGRQLAALGSPVDGTVDGAPVASVGVGDNLNGVAEHPQPHDLVERRGEAPVFVLYLPAISASSVNEVYPGGMQASG